MFIAKPTAKQLEWHDMELGVIIHFCPEMYRPDLRGSWFKTSAVREASAPSTLHPAKFDPEQWVRSAWELGAKYAVLVAKHCTGFAMWNTGVNDFSIAHTDWRGGGGDACREFVDACRKYGIKPGFYYSTGCNGYYDINDEIPQDLAGEKYRNYIKCVEDQVTELWSNYGDLAEIWFDGGVIPADQGGPNLIPIMKRYQPDAICFQGPREWTHNVRWVGNEDGLAPENCWATTNAGEGRYDGTVPDEKAGVGDPDGKYYWPAETDMPNRTHAAFGGGWSWQPNEEHLCYTPEQLLDCYIRSVGRNSNLLLGMAISTEGEFQDEEQFRAFGKLIRETFGNPKYIKENPELKNGKVRISLDREQRIGYLVIREDISEGQRIRAFRVTADGKTVYESECVGHKRIIPFRDLTAGEIVFEVTGQAASPVIRDIAVY